VSEEPGKAEETGREESHKVQEKEMPSPAAGEEQPQAPVHAGG